MKGIFSLAECLTKLLLEYPSCGNYSNNFILHKIMGICIALLNLFQKQTQEGPQAATTPPSPDSALSRTLVIKDLVLKTESKHSNVINYLSLKITVSLRILTLMSMIYLAA